MKKSTTSLLAVGLFTAQLLSAQTFLQPLLQDSSRYHYTDPFTGVEQFKSYSYHHYNGENQPSWDLFINYFGPDAVWYRYDYAYNAKKLLETSTVTRNVNAGVGPWDNWLKDEYTYDAQDRNIYYIGQLGYLSVGWENYYQEYFWFDDVAPADSSLYQLWDPMVSGWGNYRRTVNRYYPNGDVREEVEEEWNTPLDDWRPLNKNQYSYYPDGKLRKLWSASYDVSQNSFIRTDSFLYRLDGKIDSTFSTSQSSQGGNINYFIAKSQYDSNGNLIERTTVSKAQGSLWVYASQETFMPGDGVYSNDYSYENQSSYNTATQEFEVLWDISRQFVALPNGQILSREERRQRNNQGMLAHQTVDSTWYHLGTTGTQIPVNSTGANCQFANPFRPGSSILCTAPDQNTMMTIRIMNMAGQVVAQARVMPGDAWRPGVDWPSGPYFLSAWQNGKYLGSKKMVIAP